MSLQPFEIVRSEMDKVKYLIKVINNGSFYADITIGNDVHRVHPSDIMEYISDTDNVFVSTDYRVLSKLKIFVTREP